MLTCKIWGTFGADTNPENNILVDDPLDKSRCIFIPTCKIYAENEGGGKRRIMEGIEHKFVRFPSESVTLCADSLGLHVQGDVKKLIGEDTSFRVRQIVDVSDSILHL